MENDDLVRIDVGGVEMQINMRAISGMTDNSMQGDESDLARQIRRAQVKPALYIDRDPEIFGQLVKYLEKG